MVARSGIRIHGTPPQHARLLGAKMAITISGDQQDRFLFQQPSNDATLRQRSLSSMNEPGLWGHWPNLVSLCLSQAWRGLLLGRGASFYKQALRRRLIWINASSPGSLENERMLEVLTAAFVLIAAPALAGDPVEGRAIAQRWCSSCHGASDAAPPLETAVNRGDRTTATLHAWLTDPHPPMPNLALSRAEIDNLVAYLETLRKKR